MVVVLGLLAVLVWSQWASLDDCAKRVKADHAAGATGDVGTDTTCTFLGQDITHQVELESTSASGRPAFSSGC